MVSINWNAILAAARNSYQQTTPIDTHNFVQYSIFNICFAATKAVLMVKFEKVLYVKRNFPQPYFIQSNF